MGKISVHDNSGADSIGHQGTCLQLLQMAEHWGHRKYKNRKQKTDQTVLTITKARTKTTSVLLEPKKWRGTKKIVRCFVREVHAPTF